MATVPRQTSPLLRAKTDSKYVDLSIEMKHRAKTGEIVNSSNTTYFIYQCGHIQGPFTVNELIGKCLRNEIHLKSEKILFCPTSLTNNYYYTNKQLQKVWMTLDELKQNDKNGYHEEIYTNLYPLSQLNTIIHQPPIPQMTIAYNHKSYGLSLHQLIRYISIILSKVLFIIISLHFVIPLILSTFIYCLLYILCCSDKKTNLFNPCNLWTFIWHSLIFKNCQSSNKNKTEDDTESENNFYMKHKSMKQTHFVAVFVGFIATPTLIIMLLYHFWEEYDDEHVINIWMIGYIVWCLFFIITYFCINLNLWYKHLTKFIIGMHITNVHKQDLLLNLCALSSILPAVIIGYLANYYLNEKMTLECTTNALSEICIDNKCCFIVSNHDTNIANMIVVFAAIRMLSWIVIKADTTLYDITVEPFE